MSYRPPKNKQEHDRLVAILPNPTASYRIKSVSTGHPPDRSQLPLFRKHSPEVRDRAKVILAELMEKHKAKLNSKTGRLRNAYYGCLVGTATLRAKIELGLTMSPRDIGRKGWSLRRRKACVRTALGLTESGRKYHPNPWIGRELRNRAAQQSQVIHENHGEVPKCEVKLLEEAFNG
jgi:hypothetical protein